MPSRFSLTSVAPAGAVKLIAGESVRICLSKSSPTTLLVNSSRPRITGIGRPIAFSTASRSITATLTPLSLRLPTSTVTSCTSSADPGVRRPLGGDLHALLEADLPREVAVHRGHACAAVEDHRRLVAVHAAVQDDSILAEQLERDRGRSIRDGRHHGLRDLGDRQAGVERRGSSDSKQAKGDSALAFHAVSLYLRIELRR